MPNYVYPAIGLIGGTAGFLDAIDGTNLADKDMAIVSVQGDKTYFYVLDVDSAAAEASPGIIAPDANGGDKRWILTGFTPVSAATGFTIAGGTTSKTLTVEDDSLVNQDLTTDASPTFATAKLTGLTDGYIPKHTSDAVGLADSPIYTDGTSVGIGTTPGTKLDILGDLTSETSGLQRIRLKGYSAGLELLDKDGTQNWHMSIDDNNGNVLAFGAGYGPGQGIAPAMVMTPTTYRVGIGTEGPSEILDVVGNIKLAGTTGGYVRKVAEAVSAALSGASGSIAVNVPSGAKILGVQLRVDTLVTSGDGATSWTAVYVNTPTTAICSGQAFAANTKFNAIHPAYEITTGTVTITITPNSNTFSGGVIRGIVYYEAIDNMASV